MKRLHVGTCRYLYFYFSCPTGSYVLQLFNTEVNITSFILFSGVSACCQHNLNNKIYVVFSPYCYYIVNKRVPVRHTSVRTLKRNFMKKSLVKRFSDTRSRTSSQNPHSFTTIRRRADDIHYPASHIQRKARNRWRIG